MNFKRIIQQKRDLIRISLGISILALLLSFSSFANLRLFTQHQLYNIGNGIWYTISIFFPERTNLMQELEEMRAQVANLTSSQIINEEIRQENTELRNTLRFYESRPDIKERLVMANVISAGSHNDRQLLIVDKGSRNGISRGMAVIGDGGNMIGIIHEVHQFQSMIRLLQDTNSAIAVRINGVEASNGLISGSAGFVLKLDYIPNTTNISVGDIVVTESNDLKIPQGLPVGYIQEIFTNPTDPFKQANILPLTNSRRLRTVGIIR